MLITQRVAIRTLRATTGMSIQWCTEKARAMAIHPDGARLKILSTSLETLIYQTNHPEPRSRPKGISPISPRKAAKIRVNCL